MPLSSGYLSPGLTPKVSPELSACVTTKRSIAPDAVDAMQCWSTLTASASGSHEVTGTATISKTTSTTRTLTLTSTASLLMSSTCSVAATPSLSSSLPVSATTTLTPSLTTSSSRTWSPSHSGTHSGVSRTATPSWTTTLSLSATHSSMQTMSNSTTSSPSTMVSSSASRRSQTQSSATLRPSSTGSLKFCECTSSLIEALNVFLAVPDNASSGNTSSTQAILTPGTANEMSLLAAPMIRLTMWTSRSLNASLSVRRQWSLDRLGRIVTDGVETLCWAPTAASVWGDPLLVTATRLPTQPTAVDDTVTWALAVSSAGGVNETPAWVPPSAGPYQDVLARVGVVLS